MCAVLAPTLPGGLEQALDRALDPGDVEQQHRQQAGDDERGDQADDQRDRPVLVAGDRDDGHLADRRLSQRAGRVQDPDAGVVDPRDAVEAVGLARGPPRPLRRRSPPAPAIRRESATIVITITAATAITTTPRTIPIVQPVADAIVSNEPPQTNPGTDVTPDSPPCSRRQGPHIIHRGSKRFHARQARDQESSSVDARPTSLRSGSAPGRRARGRRRWSRRRRRRASRSTPSSVAGSSEPVVRPSTSLSSSGSSSSISRGASDPPSSAGTMPSSAVSAHSPFCLPRRVGVVPPRCSLGFSESWSLPPSTPPSWSAGCLPLLEESLT